MNYESTQKSFECYSKLKIKQYLTEIKIGPVFKSVFCLNVQRRTCLDATF